MTWGIVNRIYDSVHMALWAALLAFVLYFVAFVVPKLPEARAQAERLHIQEIAAENSYYCEKWGMAAGTQAHSQCLLDVQAFRANVENRFVEENDF